MLTHQDRTVEDPLEVLDAVRPLGVRHIGFKDIGAPPAVLAKLAQKIRAAGAVSYMELVCTDDDECLRSARFARDIGVDRLLGGTRVDEVLAILAGSETAYFPFSGRPRGHPTRLEGTPEEMEAQCSAFLTKGCPGVDLLAFRSTQAAPLDLVAACRRGLGEKGYLIVAGSVSSADQIRSLKAAGANAFTIGSAVFDRSFSPHRDSIGAQLEAILAACSTLER